MAAVRTFAAGAATLRLAHGLDPGAFSAGFYLATLLLLGAGGWQLVQTARAWQAARSLRKASAETSQPEALVPNEPKPRGVLALLKRQPWILLGVNPKSELRSRSCAASLAGDGVGALDPHPGALVRALRFMSPSGSRTGPGGGLVAQDRVLPSGFRRIPSFSPSRDNNPGDELPV